MRSCLTTSDSEGVVKAHPLMTLAVKLVVYGQEV